MHNKETRFLLLSSIFLVLGLIFEHLFALPFANIFYIVSAGVGLVCLVPEAIEALKNKTADENVLMCVAVISAVLLGAFVEAAVVIVLNRIGEWLEDWSHDKTLDSIKDLMRLAPQTAHVVEKKITKDCLAQDVRVGQTIRVLVGERCPLDGTIVQGSSAFDESSITGESLPCDKNLHDCVYAGSLNTQASVDICVSAAYNDSMLMHVIDMVQGAHAQKAPYESFITRFAKVYTPCVMLLAALCAFVVPGIFGLFVGFSHIDWYSWVYRALSLLVIACPCALVISVPVSFVSAITRAAKAGVLVKGGSAFDKATHITNIAFDKTGTLSEGHLHVETYTIVDNVMSDEEFFALLYGMEVQSTHPIARSICAYAKQKNIAAADIEALREEAGYGLRACYNNKRYFVGKLSIASQHIASGQKAFLEDITQQLEKTGMTAVACMQDSQLIGVVGLSDVIRPSAQDALTQLQALGFVHLAVLSGDRQACVETQTDTLALDAVYAQLLPQDKLDTIDTLRTMHGKVCMVGDGINDAPALAASDLGVSIGRQASDTACEQADVSIMSTDLTKLPWFFKLARRTMHVVRENIVFALVVKFIVVLLALFGITNMIAAVFADTGVALLVILNGMRLMTRFETSF